MSSIRSAQKQIEAAEYKAYLSCARERLLEAMEPPRFVTPNAPALVSAKEYQPC